MESLKRQLAEMSANCFTYKRISMNGERMLNNFRELVLYGKEPHIYTYEEDWKSTIDDCLEHA